MRTGSPQVEPGFGVLTSGVFDPPLPTQVLLLLVLVRLGSLQHTEPDRSLSLSQPTEPAPFWGSPQWLLELGLVASPLAPQVSLTFALLEPQLCCGLEELLQVLDLSSLLMLLLQVLLLLLLPLQLAPSSQPLCPAPPFSGLLLSQPEVGFCSPQPELPVSMPELPGPPPQPPDVWEGAAGVVLPQPELPLLSFLSSPLVPWF